MFGRQVLQIYNSVVKENEPEWAFSSKRDTDVILTSNLNRVVIPKFNQIVNMYPVKNLCSIGHKDTL